MPKAQPALSLASRTAYEEWVLRKSNQFTVVRTLGRGKRERFEQPSLKKAIETAQAGGPRLMVYAYTEDGQSVMVSPQDYARALEIVGTDV